ncbi:hypothetical protein [Paraoerskovia marina]|uniref:hypothetical protein n=1 Tax=Paraoerskovia marina TaxID=545619 RepID=UPI00049224D4|nr:hypothetical protein [Paraoerskovia marina]
MTPRWVWEYSTHTGTGALPPSPAFVSRFDAEEWLGAHWRDLARRGVTQAQLLRDGLVVTTPIPLPDH